MDAETIQVVIFDGAPVNVHLLKWARNFPHMAMASDIMLKPYPDLVSMWRNKVCDWFLRETELAHILMIDADMVPLHETQPIWDEDAPIMGCDYIGSHASRAHDGPGFIGCGCMRISREALELIVRPWFQFDLRDDGLNVDRCECGHFCGAAMKAGLHPVKKGKIGHIMPAVVSPLGEVGKGDKAQIQLLSKWNKEHEDTHKKSTHKHTGD